MKTLNFKDNHSYLNTDNVKLLKDGDIIEYYFDTELNGRKHEKVIFRGLDKTVKEGIYDEKKREVELINIDYILPECFSGRKAWINRDINDNWYHYCIYTNGWNPLHMVTVNEEKWEDLCKKNNFNNFLSFEEQEQKEEKKNSELILSNSKLIGKVYNISENDYKSIENNLTQYPIEHHFNDIIGVNKRKRSLVRYGNNNFSVPFMSASVNTPQIKVPTLDFYINDNSYRVVIGNLKSFKEKLNNIINEN